MGTIYRKTDKGQAEIETRAHRLLPRLRTALILVDGRRSDNELRPLLPGDSTQSFHALFEAGFIEVVRVVEERAEPRPPPPPSAEPRSRQFEQRRRDAVRGLIDLVGPLGDAVAMRIEKCKDWGELRPAVELARQVVEYARGGALAADYARRFSDLPPA